MQDSYGFYSEAEKKLIFNENQYYNLKNYIITKSKDMDYSDL